MIDMPFIDRKKREYRYGEFFPYEFSPFGYNETVANEYFPLEKQKILAEGFNHSDYESESMHEVSAYEIPDDLRNVGDDILEKILPSEKPYRIIPMELAFYRRF